ncbi:MAG: YicC family protein [Muribaculaceae bacterium]|nr:YicC family protein [Bacteroides sp.]MDE6255615.1 YicC family protein [Muribaculaceae bacterium]
MILSMTGFGRGCASSPTKKITVEIKSLNSKQFDFSMRVPSFFRELEVETRNKMASEFERGKVDVTVSVENLAVETSASINIPLLASYREQLENMKAHLDLPDPTDWYMLLLRMPDAMKTETGKMEKVDADAFVKACEEAAAALTDFRAQEGEKLYLFFREKISNIRQLLAEIEPYEESRVPKIRARLEEQLSRLSSIEYDKGRLEQELIYYIEKLDISEEKLRLNAHLDYFLQTLDGEEKGKGQGQGKKLGFIAQEMGREINTLGSKSNQAEMQKIVVRMKDELEQIKEQVLNVL